MRWLIGAGLAVLLAVGVLVTGAAAQSTPVVPGQSIGGFRLGQDISPIVDSLGPLHSEDDLPGAALTGYYWPLKRIGAIVDKDSHKVVGLVVSLDDTYTTDKGVAAGSEMEQVRTAYGAEDSVENHQDDETLVYDKLGVAFVVDKAGALGSRVSVIFVFGSGHYHEIFRDQ